ncbi:SusF/SusE family outer membrane protein [Chryseobacterium sp. H3056]|uniref:SusF/SusE family outer membrane protein n=1 Tax=Kaistella daneshvariae TaxID=2487074 RepID=A0A3N0WSC1_9FLAO|nr:SusF/SusE family outer membrane protein [Kaistella daneshvariae]ROI07815.1 SusF/SusE family outer membrane protein [Kaistella daneshvariae]
MKTLYTIINRNRKLLFLLPLGIFLAFFSCREELEAEKFDISELTVKTSEFQELLPKMYNSKYNFNWTPANNQGTSSSITYHLEIDKKDNNFSNPQVYEVGKNVYSYDITVGALNTLLVETYGATPGTPITMQARLTATFGNSSVQSQSAVTDFTLTPFKTFTKTLFAVGDATPNGWDISKATELTVSATNPAEFVYYGQLKAGNFKFAVNQDGCWCQDFYTKDPTDDTKIVYNEGGSGADLQWVIDNAGLYKVTVNVLDLTINIEEMNAPQFSNLWIVGDASPSGWDINTPVGFTQDQSNPFIFTLECSLKEGNFKILAGATGDWCGNWYRPLVDNQDLNATGVQQLSGCDPDFKWKVSAAAAGRYKITLNASNNTIKFEPVNVYMIGDATPNGWNIGTLTPMQKNGSVYTWTGPLTAGEFKFTKFNTTWCDGTELVADTPNQSIANTAFHAREKCAGDDNKWKVTAPGTYTITLNLDTNTLNIQ